MKRQMKRFKVNLIQTICQHLYVVANDEDEALEIAEDAMRYRFETYSNSTCGFDEPYDDWEDDDSTYKVELSTDGIEEWGEMSFELDENEEVEDVELEYSDEEKDDE